MSTGAGATAPVPETLGIPVAVGAAVQVKAVQASGVGVLPTITLEDDVRHR